jgi:hypothetical protein
MPDGIEKQIMDRLADPNKTAEQKANDFALELIQAYQKIESYSPALMLYTALKDDLKQFLELK